MNIKKLDTKNQTARYEATVPVKELSELFEKALVKLSSSTNIEGFRKGKAPVEIARKTIGKEKIYDQLLQDLMPQIYKKIVEMDKLRPLISPHVELKQAKEGEDWVIEMKIALEPKVKVPDYKKIVASVKAESKKEDIWVPGKEDEDNADAKKVEKRENFLNNVLKQLMEKTEIELSDLIIEEEINQRLARLVDDVRKIGLTVEGYLASRQTTDEKLKEEFKTDILNTYKMEYALNEIGDAEKISVEQSELESVMGQITDPAQREAAQKNAYVYSMMLRKQKIIDFLSSL